MLLAGVMTGTSLDAIDVAICDINSEGQQVQVGTDPRWAAGLYYIRIYNNKTRLIRKSSFIVQ